MTGNHLVFAAFAALVVAGALTLATGPAVADSTGSAPAVDEILWPPEDRFDRANRSALGATLLAVDDPTVVAREPLHSIGIERLGPERSEIVLRGGAAGEERLSVPHQPIADDDKQRSPTRISMDPGGLIPLVQVMPTVPERGVEPAVRVYGPPGAFETTATNGSDWRSLTEASMTLGTQLGLPASNGDGFETEWRTAAGAAHPWANEDGPEASLVDSELCTEEEPTDCYRISVGCENCTLTHGRVHPTPGEQLTSATDSDVKVRSMDGFSRILFDGAEPVHLSMDTAVDLNTSVFVDPGEARNQVIANLSERGYQIDQTYGEQVSELTKTSMNLSWAENGRRIDAAHYEWFTIVNQTGNESSAAYNVDLQQDAFSGEIVGFEIRPNAVSHEDGEENNTRDTESGQSTPADDRDPTEGMNDTNEDDGNESAPRQTPMPITPFLAALAAFAVLIRRQRG